MINFDKEVRKVLDQYKEEVKKAVDKCARDTAEETAQKLRDTSPKKTGKYASGWKSRKLGKSYIVYNAKKPGLTNLLEKSHLISNHYGTYGRTSPVHGQYIHIKPAEEWAKNEFIKKVERELK